jgi:hypothetical protein
LLKGRCIVLAQQQQQQQHMTMRTFDNNCLE